MLGASSQKRNERGRAIKKCWEKFACRYHHQAIFGKLDWNNYVPLFLANIWVAASDFILGHDLYVNFLGSIHKPIDDSIDVHGK